MLGSVLSTLHVLVHLILTVAYEVGTIIFEEAEAQSVACPRSHSQDLNPAVLAPGVGFDSRGLVTFLPSSLCPAVSALPCVTNSPGQGEPVTSPHVATSHQSKVTLER